MVATDLLQRVASMNPQRRTAFAELLAERGAEYGIYPLLRAQSRIWFADQLFPGTAVYNIPYAFHLTGAVDSYALARAFDELVSRHEAVRVTLFDLDGTPWQTVRPPWDGVLEAQDLTDIDADPDALRRMAAAEASRPFVLTEGPLLRAKLVRFAADNSLLMITAHHIITDGWSMRTFLSELAACYADTVHSGQMPRFGELLAYDRALAQQTDHAERRHHGSQTFWTEYLRGAPLALQLPLDRPRPAVTRMQGAVVEFHWPAGLVAEIAEFARSYSVTPFAVLLASYTAMLHRYADAEDILIGTAAANRDAVGGSDTVGLFVNTLVLRSKLNGEVSFAEHVTQAMSAIAGAQRHQEFAFESLVDILQPDRDPSYHPIYQVMCGLQNSDADDFELAGTVARAVPLHSGTTKCDLTMTFALGGQSLHGWLEYDSDLFDQATAEQMAHHVKALLTAGLAAPRQPVMLLPMLSQTEHALLADQWSRSTGVQPSTLLPHEVFERQADLTPSARAVSFQDEAMSYRELDDAANRLAAVLRDRGAGPEDLIGIHLPRSMNMAVCVLAIWKAGAAYVPLDAELPEGRVALILEDSGARLVLTTAELATRLPASVAALDVTRAQRPAERVRARSTSANLAYVIYTSGSTGQPKGVSAPLASVVNYHRGSQEVVASGSADRVLQVASLGFDASVGEIVWSLLSGAELVFAPRHELQPGPELEKTIIERGITLALLSPTVLSHLRAERLPGFRTLLIGSEMVPPQLADEWSRGRNLVYVYGPTETTVISTAWHYTGPESVSPIGRPLLNEEVYILDRRMQPVARGVRGELYIGGASLARGYLGRAGLTARQFVPDPFSGRPGARLYRTGDVVRFRPDGVIECFGRSDSQVKIRGIRIELDEIQHVLGRQPGVHACAVVTKTFGDDDDVRIVAYVQTLRPGPLDEPGLREGLRQVLPEYMVPSRFVAVSTIPQTANGKRDTTALEAMTLPVEASQPAMPQLTNQIERVVTAAWRQVLQRDVVGVDDNFFDLGGNSLLISKVAAVLHRDLGQPVGALALLRNPTVRSLARHLGGDKTVTDSQVTRDVSVARQQRRQQSAVRAQRRAGHDNGGAHE